MKLPDGIFTHDDLTDKEFRLLVACIAEANGAGELQASATKLGKMIHSDVRYTFKMLSNITQKGYIVTTAGGNGRAPAKRKLTYKAMKGLPTG